ncbi:MAG: hypothetical protein ACXW3X_07715 [Rhodoplanes sp.]
MAADDARLEGLEKSRKKRQAEAKANLEALRPEFEDLRRAVGSANHAAEIIAKRHPELGLKADAIRRRFRRQPN